MLISVLIFLPFLSALLVLALKNNAVKYTALGVSLLELALTLFAIQKLKADPGAPLLNVTQTWIASLGISFKVGVDGISMLLLLLTNLLVPFIILSSFNHNYPKQNIFYSLILIMQMALVGVFSALDGFLFYVFWELALIPIYFIC